MRLQSSLLMEVWSQELVPIRLAVPIERRIRAVARPQPWRWQIHPSALLTNEWPSFEFDLGSRRFCELLASASRNVPPSVRTQIHVHPRLRGNGDRSPRLRLK